MELERDFARLLDSAPHVTCPGCSVDMTIRNLLPAAEAQNFTGTYRCPKCGTETQREFTALS